MPTSYAQQRGGSGITSCGNLGDPAQCPSLGRWICSSGTAWLCWWPQAPLSQVSGPLWQLRWGLEGKEDSAKCCVCILHAPSLQQPYQHLCCRTGLNPHLQCGLYWSLMWCPRALGFRDPVTLWFQPQAGLEAGGLLCILKTSEPLWTKELLYSYLEFKLPLLQLKPAVPATDQETHLPFCLRNRE